MRLFFDTSVLVSAALVQHPQHASSLAAYAQATKINAFTSAHCLAETYATLTRLPGAQRMTCEEAVFFVEDARKRLTVIPLDVEDYIKTIHSLAAAGISGGAIYDALLARCAIKSGAEIVYTWDVADFRRVAPEIAKQVRTP